MDLFEQTGVLLHRQDFDVVGGAPRVRAISEEIASARVAATGGATARTPASPDTKRLSDVAPAVARPGDRATIRASPTAQTQVYCPVTPCLIAPFLSPPFLAAPFLALPFLAFPPFLSPPFF